MKTDNKFDLMIIATFHLLFWSLEIWSFDPPVFKNALISLKVEQVSVGLNFTQLVIYLSIANAIFFLMDVGLLKLFCILSVCTLFVCVSFLCLLSVHQSVICQKTFQQNNSWNFWKKCQIISKQLLVTWIKLTTVISIMICCIICLINRGILFFGIKLKGYLHFFRPNFS
jgi:hypothetical protein